MRMGNAVALGALLMTFSTGFLDCSSRTQDGYPSVSALQGNWQSDQDDSLDSLIFRDAAEAAEIEGLPNSSLPGSYEAYQLRDGVQVMVQSGSYDIERREIGLIDRYEVDILVRTVSWDLGGISEGTQLEDRLDNFSGRAFELLPIGERLSTETEARVFRTLGGL